MKLSESFKASSLDEVKAAIAGGKLVVYSVGRPSSPDKPVQRSGVLATLSFATPAFSPENDGISPLFSDNPVVATGTGTPGFARAFKADGSTVVAQFSAGAGDAEVKLNQVSVTAKYPIKLTELKLELPKV